MSTPPPISPPGPRPRPRPPPPRRDDCPGPGPARSGRVTNARGGPSPARPIDRPGTWTAEAGTGASRWLRAGHPRRVLREAYPRSLLEGSDDNRFHGTAGPGRQAARRDGPRGQRRVLRAQGEPSRTGGAGVRRGPLHRSWQVDGRVGDPPKPLARVRLVRGAARPAGGDPRGGGGHRVLPRQLSGGLLAG